MSDYVLSIDPGVSSALAILAYDEDSISLAYATQFSGGAAALKNWLDENWDGRLWDSYHDRPNNRGLNHWKLGLADPVTIDESEEYDYEGEEILVPANLTVLCEKFTARNTRGFSYTTASLEPLRCEGILIGMDVMPDYSPSEKRWRDPGLQYLVGGKDKADKKKRQAAFLKDSGFYVTGKDFGTPDADDARSAIAHGIAYLLREKKNKFAYKLVTDWTEAHG